MNDVFCVEANFPIKSISGFLSNSWKITSLSGYSIAILQNISEKEDFFLDFRTNWSIETNKSLESFFCDVRCKICDKNHLKIDADFTVDSISRKNSSSGVRISSL